MNKVFLFLSVIIWAVSGNAQHRVTFKVKQETYIRKAPIFIAGTFNQWDTTSSKAYQLKDLGQGLYSITLVLPAGEIQYKFHRGNWNTVEKSFEGNEVANRKLVVQRDTLVNEQIRAWRDNILEDKWRGLETETSDFRRLRLVNSLANTYAFNVDLFNADSALKYTGKSMQLIRQMTHAESRSGDSSQAYTLELMSAQEVTGYVLHSLGNYTKALENRLDNVRLAETIPDRLHLAQTYRSVASDYASMGDLDRTLAYGLMSDSVLRYADKGSDSYPLSLFYSKELISETYLKLGQGEKALDYARQARDIDTRNLIDYVMQAKAFLLANAYKASNKPDSAIATYRYVLSNNLAYNIFLSFRSRVGLGNIFLARGQADSSLWYLKQAYRDVRDNAEMVRIFGEDPLYHQAQVTPLLADVYMRNGQPDSAYKYLSLSVALKDSLFSADKIRQFQLITFNENTRQQELEQKAQMAEEAYRTRLKFYGLLGCLAAFLALAFVLYRSNRHKQKANALLAVQKTQIEHALHDLKDTQAQLIQSEKMASIGELTAGIAHEIQNPLNFVNNFSDVSVDLSRELSEKLDEGDLQEAKLLATDIASNLEKINQHGERASGIVRAMLQHSRGSSGEKEIVDINAICEEYLRLAFHGYKAKEKTFNVNLETSFDPQVGTISTVPQDLGRVLLNIINNAFYAVHDRKLKTADPGFEPKVELISQKIASQGKAYIQILIKDNGNGIPPELKHKVFQPFFTTKPTGQGTGLGLSLAYDIVTKGNGGSLSVDSTLGEGTCFDIRLPVS